MKRIKKKYVLIEVVDTLLRTSGLDSNGTHLAISFADDIFFF